MVVNFNQVRGGHFRKQVGKEFEQRFEAYCSHAQDVSLIRINDGAKQVAPNKFIRLSQPFDWLLFVKEHAIFMDTKTCLGNQYPLNEKSFLNQFHNFEIIDKHKFITGYLVEFREAGEYRWYNFAKLKEIYSRRKSLVPNDGLLLGETFPMNIDFQKITHIPE